MSYLKTLAKCLLCGADVQIKRLKDAARATCEHCQEGQRLLRCAGHKERAATSHREAAPKLKGPARAAAYLRASAERLEAAAYVLEASAHGARGSLPGYERRWLAWARGRAHWAADMARNTLPLVQEARDAAGHGLVAVPGDGMLPAAPASAPRLRIVGLCEPSEELFDP